MEVVTGGQLVVTQLFVKVPGVAVQVCTGVGPPVTLVHVVVVQLLP